MDKLLSIVIPSYNVGNTLSNILDNLVNCHTLDRLDILVVNDGSTDQTAKIADKYVAEYPESIQLITQVNGGHGSTINTGIKYATGRFFKVVDGDDWLDSANLDRFVNLLKLEDVDLVLTPFWVFNDKTKRKYVKEIKSEDIRWNQKYYLKDRKIAPVPSMHTYTLRTKLLKENGIKIDEHAYYVDIEYILYPIPYVKTYKFVNLPLYNYRVNQADQSITLGNMVKNSKQHEMVIEHVNEYIVEHINGINENQRELMVNRLSRMIATQMKIISVEPIKSVTKAKLVKFYQHAKDNYYFEIQDINLPMKMLVKSHFLLFPLIHYLAIWKMNLFHY
ncbi:glycosyltransferase family 2 protein [Companilactobacillus allii]|uniref:Glycosyltransferase 2-like domain-containing protein n=1 Tax=Companilactobacillus allii TaxID=1847728 RepID=A0A1P8Q294_9LACO|nr:glycosyltransferase family A protein [Companilactobacillus allii]APX71978.1 hypothetical protein BTM29_05140 [Companilactobacillus allii]USQ69073.1 glycosyltransferase family 2 protein [Companilactobacillus allii]